MQKGILYRALLVLALIAWAMGGFALDRWFTGEEAKVARHIYIFAASWEPTPCSACR